MTRAWLIGASGVNYYLPLVPKDAADPTIPLIADWTDPHTSVAEKSVFEETTHDWVAAKHDPPAFPAIYLMSEGSVDMVGTPTPNGEMRETSAPLVLTARYVTNLSDPRAARRNAEYTLRAMLRSMRELMKDANDASRTRNSIKVVSMADPASYLPITEQVGNGFVSGALVVNLEMRDANPSF